MSESVLNSENQNPWASLSDNELVKLICSGNLELHNELFGEILNRYQHQILVYCTRFLNWHREDGEDATSNTFVKAYVNLNSFNPKLKFSSWLYRIAHNEAVNKIQKNSQNWTIPLESNDFGSKNFESPTISDLDKVLNQLKPDDKNILLLFYIQELSLEEIGEILKITVGNAKVKLHRAREKAKKLAK